MAEVMSDDHEPEELDDVDVINRSVSINEMRDAARSRTYNKQSVMNLREWTRGRDAATYDRKVVDVIERLLLTVISLYEKLERAERDLEGMRSAHRASTSSVSNWQTEARIWKDEATRRDSNLRRNLDLARAQIEHYRSVERYRLESLIDRSGVDPNHDEVFAFIRETVAAEVATRIDVIKKRLQEQAKQARKRARERAKKT